MSLEVNALDFSEQQQQQHVMHVLSIWISQYLRLCRARQP